MSEGKTIIFGGGESGIASMLPTLLQNRGVDPAYLMGLLNNNNGGGFFGGNGGFQDIIALIVIAAIFGNGNGNGIFGGGGNNNGNAEREMIMQTLNRNGIDINQLAQAVGSSSDKILAGINTVSQAICGLGNQMGQNTNQILTAMLQGNNALTNQIASCCCDLKGVIAGLGTGMERGFSQIAFNDERNKCDLQNTIKDSTAQILAGQRAAEMREMQRDLAAKDEKIAALTTQLGLEHQNQYTTQVVAQAIAPVNAAIGALQSDVNGIKCKLPETATVPNPPGVLIPNCVAAQYGVYGAFPFGNNGSFF